ncbi:MAG: chromosomal replication initiator protein DnaA [Oscillospiraceae bacterium]|nr:chromosomal replication initiator protein DnaA [Oscillospiraceae bacterium]
MNSFSEIFEFIKSKLDLSDTATKLWIEPIKPIKLANNKAILFVSSEYGRQIVAENFTLVFEKEFQDVLGFPVEVEFLCENDLTSEQKQKMHIPELQDDEFIKNKLNQAEVAGYYKYTFNTFIVGDSNNLAYAACKGVAHGTANSGYNPLYIYSEPGLGKTHLLSAVKHEMLKKSPNLNISLVSADSFVNDFISSLNYKNTDEFNNKYRNLDMLLLDDVQFFSSKKESQNALFHIFNELHSKGKQIILTSDRPPKEINDIESRLRSRFEWGLLADIAVPEFETRLAIIKRKAELIGLDIPNNVMEYIADKLKNNIRQLEGAITKINALRVVTEVSPTIVMAQNVIKDVLSDQQPIPITVEKIINEVSIRHSVLPGEIRSQNRSAQISTARQVAIYAVHRITNLSYTAIGIEFGNRDHSTIVYAINKVKSIMNKDSIFKGKVEDLIKNMTNII